MAYLKFENITKSFGDKLAVNNVNLEINKGEIFGIIGLSGAGKSTLIRMINRLETPTEGNILFEGENILKWTDEKIRLYRKKTGMIFQSFNLLSSRTVFDNVALSLELLGIPKKEREGKVEELLKLVDLYEHRDKYINNLSGGQKQRVAIARALALEPEILLSDESTSSLDPITSNSILELLKDINRKLGITIILITHQMEVIKKICDRVAVMKNGEIIELSTVRELFISPRTELARNLISDLRLEVQTGRKNTIKLIFDGEQSDIPYVSVLTRKFNIDINILGGAIDTLSNDNKVGHLVLEIEADEITEVIEWLKGHKLGVEVIN
jgi:ABC transporter related protein